MLTYAIFKLRKKDELRLFVIARITEDATVVPKHVPNYKGTPGFVEEHLPGGRKDLHVGPHPALTKTGSFAVLCFALPGRACA